MKDSTQLKIKAIVKAYKDKFPEEFKATAEYIKEKNRNMRKDAAVLKSELLQRALYELPEKLDDMLRFELNKEQLKELDETKGGRWFAYTFPMFSFGKYQKRNNK